MAAEARLADRGVGVVEMNVERGGWLGGLWKGWVGAVRGYCWPCAERAVVVHDSEGGLDTNHHEVQMERMSSKDLDVKGDLDVEESWIIALMLTLLGTLSRDGMHFHGTSPPQSHPSQFSRSAAISSRSAAHKMPCSLPSQGPPALHLHDPIVRQILQPEHFGS